MPHGPNGEWRPADPIARAVHVMKVATGQVEETFKSPPKDVGALARRKSAEKAGKARAASQTPEGRKKLATKAAAARWGTPTAVGG